MTTALALPARSSLAGRILPFAILSALVATCGLVLFATMMSPLKDDLAWLLYVAHKWLGGQQLYVDLIEVNPPLIIWISALPMAVAEWAAVAPKLTALPFFALCVLGASWWAANILRGFTPLFRNRFLVFALAATVLLGIAGPELGQREHLLAAAMLPYLCLTARTLGEVRPRIWTALAVGLLAGLGCALKPRYVLVFVAVECLMLLRGFRPWRTTNLAAAAAVLGYLALVLILHPAYLERAVPLALALYGATDTAFRLMLTDNLAVMLGEAAVLLVWWINRRTLPESDLILVLGLFAVVSTVVCFLDGKNWFYHRLPATIVTTLALVCCFAALVSRPATAIRRQIPALLLVGAGVFAFTIAATQRLKPQVELACDPDRSTEARLEKLIRRERAKTYVAFSEWIALGFPVVNNTGVVWASRFDSMWALKGELWRARFDPGAPAEWPIRHWVARDFLIGCPDLVVVDARESLNYIAVLSASDLAFASAWRQYRQIASFDGLHVFKHHGDVHCTGQPKQQLQAQALPSIPSSHAP